MRKLVTGIDIGSTSVRVVVSELPSELKHDTKPQVVAFGESISRGIKHGYIINKYDATRSLKEALHQAETALGASIQEAFISIGGISLSSYRVNNACILGKDSTGIANEKHLQTLKVKAREKFMSQFRNRKIIFHETLSYKIDGQLVLGHPIGMEGNKLSASHLLVAVLDNNYEDLVQVVSDTGIDVLDVVPAPLVTSLAALTERQRDAGCVLADIGAETTSVAVFKDNKLISMNVFKIGSSNITNDLALMLKISLEDAERVKIDNNDPSARNFKLKQTADEVISARLEDIFMVIEKHLHTIHRAGDLPAGIILIGGGSKLTSIEDFARATLRLPSKTININHTANNKRRPFTDNEWVVAYGLCHLPLIGNYDSHNSFKRLIRNLKSKISNIVDQLMP